MAKVHAKITRVKTASSQRARASLRCRGDDRGVLKGEIGHHDDGHRQGAQRLRRADRQPEVEIVVDRDRAGDAGATAGGRCRRPGQEDGEGDGDRQCVARVDESALAGGASDAVGVRDEQVDHQGRHQPEAQQMAGMNPAPAGEVRGQAQDAQGVDEGQAGQDHHEGAHPARRHDQPAGDARPPPDDCGPDRHRVVHRRRVAESLREVDLGQCRGDEQAARDQVAGHGHRAPSPNREHLASISGRRRRGPSNVEASGW